MTAKKITFIIFVTSLLVLVPSNWRFLKEAGVPLKKVRRALRRR
jgi:hypothetical protein